MKRIDEVQLTGKTAIENMPLEVIGADGKPKTKYDKAVKTAKAPAGLYVSVQNGKKTFIVRQGGAKETLGTVRDKSGVGLYTLEAACKRANQLLLDADKVGGLKEYRKLKREAKQAEAEQAQNEREQQEAEKGKRQFTVGKLIREYLNDQSVERLRSFNKIRQTLELSALDPIRDMPAVEVRAKHLRDIKESLHETPVQSNRILAYLRSAFNWAVDMEKLEFSPFTMARRLFYKEESKDRNLTWEELRVLFRELPDSTLTQTEQELLELLLLTGMRYGEARQAKTAHIDHLNQTLTIPAEIEKNKKKHVVHLGDRAYEICTRREGEYIFLSRAAELKGKEAPYPDHQLSKSIGIALRGRDVKGRSEVKPSITLKDFTAHDARRTFESRAIEQFNDNDVHAFTGHKLGGTKGTYQIVSVERRREIAKYMNDRMMAAKDGNVLQLVTA